MIKHEFQQLPMAKIAFGNRFRKDYGDIDELKSDIKTHGLLQPIGVMKKKTGKADYVVCYGGRRFLACRDLDFKTIPAMVYETMPEHLFRTLELLENVSRKEMSWQEEVLLTKRIHDLQVSQLGTAVPGVEDSGWGKEDTARLMGKSRTSVTLDIEAASVLEENPDLLEDCRNKSEVYRRIKRIKKAVIQQEQVKRLPETASSKAIESQYILGDFFEGVKSIPDASIDLIECDPPYGVEFSGGNVTKEEIENLRIETKESGQLYSEFLPKVIKECARVLKPAGWLIMWTPVYSEPLESKGIPTMGFFRVLMTEAGLKVCRIPGVWTKQRLSGSDSAGLSRNPSRVLASAYEPFYYATKMNGVITRQGRSNVFSYPTLPAAHKCHPTERPIELIQDVLLTFGDIGNKVLIPFLGSGNTILAAANIGMMAFGWELNNQYKPAFQKKVRGTEPGQYRSYNEPKPPRDKKLKAKITADLESAKTSVDVEKRAEKQWLNVLSKRAKEQSK